MDGPILAQLKMDLHPQSNSWTVESVDFKRLFFTLLRSENEFHFSFSGHYIVCCPVLISISMPAVLCFVKRCVLFYFFDTTGILSIRLHHRSREAAEYLPTTIGRFHPWTSRGTFSTTIGSLKTVPFKIFLIVPFGLRHICLSPNSSTLASSGVIVAHFMPTPTRCRSQSIKHHVRNGSTARLQSNLSCLYSVCGVNRDLVVSIVTVRESKIEILCLQVQIWKDELHTTSESINIWRLKAQHIVSQA